MGDAGTCAQCGAELQANFKFCAACGAPVTEADQTTGHEPVRLPGAGAEHTGATGVAAVEDSGPLAPVLAEPDPGTTVLVVVKGPSAGERFELVDQTLTVGRAEDNAIFLDDITVSRHHARFEHNGSHWQLSDLGSLNGTYVNREPVEVVQLASGDEVQIGKYRFQFLSAATATA